MYTYKYIYIYIQILRMHIIVYMHIYKSYIYIHTYKSYVYIYMYIYIYKLYIYIQIIYIHLSYQTLQNDSHQITISSRGQLAKGQRNTSVSTWRISLDTKTCRGNPRVVDGENYPPVSSNMAGWKMDHRTQ